MLAFLKHFTAYSVESNRGHDDYTIDPCAPLPALCRFPHCCCSYDFFDTYVAQYRRAFALSNATGVMCRFYPRTFVATRF